MDKAGSGNREVEVELTGQVPPLTMLSNDKAFGMPADKPPEWPELSESLLLSYSCEEVIDERPGFGVCAGRRYGREYTILRRAPSEECTESREVSGFRICRSENEKLCVPDRKCWGKNALGINRQVCLDWLMPCDVVP